jgi:hypothetical protein
MSELKRRKGSKRKPLPIPVVLELLRLKVFAKPKPAGRGLRIYGTIGPKRDDRQKGA